MKFTIAQIGTNRLEKVLLSNKHQDPKLIIDAMKSDIERVLSSYLDDFSVVIEVGQNQENTNFDISVCAKRIKSFGTLPY